MLQVKTSWQEALSNLITEPKELLSLLELDPALLASAEASARLFPLKVPRNFVARMEKGNPHDPLLRQILPLDAELDIDPNYVKDPLNETNANPIPGLLHKYHGRVLVTLTGACAVHCRYCFRRHFPYANNNPGTRGWEKLFAYLQSDTSISEVILSGGDPLAVHDKLLSAFTDQLTRITHIKRLRIHTRIPIVLPERVTPELLQWLKLLALDVAIVIHANHPREINHDVEQSLEDLQQAGAILLNQSVLLRGVNDDASVLGELSEKLFHAGVVPYYLHVLDKVQGAAHFDLPLETAKALHAQLLQSLPGYLVPRLACETPGASAKSLL